MSVPIEKLRIGSRWYHQSSGATYEVTGFSISTATNQPDVLYKCVHPSPKAGLYVSEVGIEELKERTFNRAIGEFLGHVKDEQTGLWRERFRWLAPGETGEKEESNAGA